MSNTKTAAPYSEDNPDHVPNPYYQTGVVDTTGTATNHPDIHSISPVFAQAKAEAFGAAVEAAAEGDTSTLVVEDSHGRISDEERADLERAKVAADDEADDELQAKIKGAQTSDPDGEATARRDGANDGDDDHPSRRGEPLGGHTSGGSAAGASTAGGRADGEKGNSDELPSDTAPKHEWAKFADAHSLQADKSLNKDEFVAAVKKEYKKS